MALALAAESSSEPYKGITLIHRTESAPRPFSARIVRIDLTTPGLRFSLTPKSGSREATRQTTLEFLNEQKASLAINGHFFEPFPSIDKECFLIGLAASNGDVYSDFEQPAQSYAIMADAPALDIAEDNTASIVTKQDQRKVFNTISGSARIITDGAVTVPQYAAGQLTPGGPGNYSNAKSWYDVPNARTLIGLSEDTKTLTLFTVDRAKDSQGLTVGEAATLLAKDYKVHNALNLDGGGSTTLALRNPETNQGEIVNATQNRAVCSNLAVFAPAK